MNGIKQVNKTDKPILNILNGLPSERNPVWLMRQAGRYLPEYRSLRAKAGSFLDLCLTPSHAAEVTLQPVKRFPLDAAILFADILLIPYALNQKLEFREGEGPVLEGLGEQGDLSKFSFQRNKLDPVMETLQIVKKKIPPETALIGFCGGLWTVAAYMIDGNSRNNFTQAKKWAAEKPELLDRLIALLLDASEYYLCKQIEAGAEILQLFESWAGLLEDEKFDRWVIRPTKELVARVKRKYPHVPIIGFPREAGMKYAAYASQTGINALGIDQNITLDYAASQLQPIKTLQGNLDPKLLVEGGEKMLQAAEAILKKFGPRHIFNLGHGVVPETPPDHVGQLVEFVHGFKTSQ